MSATASRPVCSGLRLLDVSSVSGLLQVHPNTVRHLIDRGDLSAVRIGKAVRISVASIEDFVRRGGSKGPDGE